MIESVKKTRFSLGFIFENTVNDELCFLEFCISAKINVFVNNSFDAFLLRSDVNLQNDLIEAFEKVSQASKSIIDKNGVKHIYNLEIISYNFNDNFKESDKVILNDSFYITTNPHGRKSIVLNEKIKFDATHFTEEINNGRYSISQILKHNNVHRYLINNLFNISTIYANDETRLR